MSFQVEVLPAELLRTVHNEIRNDGADDPIARPKPEMTILDSEQMRSVAHCFLKTKSFCVP